MKFGPGDVENVRPQIIENGATTNQPVAYHNFLKRLLNPFRCQSSLSMAGYLLTINLHEIWDRRS